LANIKSQIKRNRQNDKHRVRNRVFRGRARTAVRNAQSAIQAGDAEASQAEVLKAISALDKAAEKGVLHKNNAARRKGRLMKMYAAMKPVEKKIEEPKPQAEAAPEPKKKTAAKAAPAAKKAAAEKAPEKTASAKTKKPAAAKKPAAKKTGSTSSAKPKKTAAKK
jgi:small subunit ribosomal protein S20